MITRGMAQGSSSALSGTSALTETQDQTQDASSRVDEDIQPLPVVGNENILQMPANPRRPRERPDLEDVVTQQTELLAAMLLLLYKVTWTTQRQIQPSNGADWPNHRKLPGPGRRSCAADGDVALHEGAGTDG